MTKRVTVKTIQKFKDENEKFSVLTAYDYSTAKYLDEAGIDIILIGDSLAMVALGYETTHSIGMNEMSIFTKAVAKGAERAMVVTDMPFLSYHTDIPTAVKNCGEMVKCGANAVKIEGFSEYILNVIKRLVETGIPVMGHLGFTPQFINTLGGYKIQGKTAEMTEEILANAQKLEAAGCFAVVLELMPAESAKYITDNLNIPTIGIGAGADCSGQIVVTDDILGKFTDFKPKFVKKYADLHNVVLESVSQYKNEVKTLAFPSQNESFELSSEEVNKLNI